MPRKSGVRVEGKEVQVLSGVESKVQGAAYKVTNEASCTLDFDGKLIARGAFLPITIQDEHERWDEMNDVGWVQSAKSDQRGLPQRRASYLSDGWQAVHLKHFPFPIHVPAFLFCK